MRYTFLILFLLTTTFSVRSQTGLDTIPEFKILKEKLSDLTTQFEQQKSNSNSISKEVEFLQNSRKNLIQQIDSLAAQLAKLELESTNRSLDNLKSLRGELSMNKQLLSKDLKAYQLYSDSLTALLNKRIDTNRAGLRAEELRISEIKEKGQVIDDSVNSLVNTVSNTRLFSIVLIAVFVLVISFFIFQLTKRIKTSGLSLESKIDQESIKLDNKLIELLEKHVKLIESSQNVPRGNVEVDHSLALKVADEIARIETNMSRMDQSVNGLGHMRSGINRIKDNFLAKGYEIIEMLGKDYVEGIKASAIMIEDDSLEEGKQIITRVIKPQINFEGQMIQAAQIEVSQG